MALSAFITNPSADRLRAGETVLLPFRGERLEGVVIEDRGDIGVGGRQLVRVRVEVSDEAAHREFELPATDVERVR